MTFENLKEILKSEKVDEYSYDICGAGRVKGYEGYIIKQTPSGYDVCYTERGEELFVAWFSSEHEACIGFLKELVADGRAKFAKYIQ